MKQRCLDPKHFSYKHYGGKGVEIYQPWLDFDTFRADIIKLIGDRLGLECTLGRIAPFADYAPGEVEWQTRSQQNTGLLDRSKDAVEVDGESRTKSEWAALLGIKYKTLVSRIRHGWGLDAYRIHKGGRRIDPRDKVIVECEDADHWSDQV